MSADRELARALRTVAIPGEAEAEERSWEVVRAAYADRSPLRQPAARGRRLALGLAGGLALLAIGLSPAGAKVGDAIKDVLGIGAEDASPTLRSLPAAGELLVESEQGPWIVREDGSKRLLGDYDEAAWSPHGLFIAVTSGHELIAVDPVGNVRWTITAPGPVHDPRWSGIDFNTRIAFRSGGALWVVAGDGTGAHRVARKVAPTPPLWLRRPGVTKVVPGSVESFPYTLAYLDPDGDPRVVDPETGTPLNVHVGRAHERQLLGSAKPSPVDTLSAAIEREGGRSVLTIRGNGRRRVAFSASGRLTGPTWSPDGRWLLVGWPAADQWLFFDAGRPRHVKRFGRISEQFDPGGEGPAPFPRVSGWILPQR